MTPLTLLINNVDSNYLQVFSELIKGGANPLLKDESGNTPLHLAVEKNKIDIVASLINVSNNITELLEQHNNDNETPIDIAEENNNQEILKYFKDYMNQREPIDFFKQKTKRLKKRLTPSQYEDLKEEYEELRQKNLSNGEDKNKLNRLKEKFVQKLVNMGILEEYEEYEEDIK
jgi:ankyrin repeat protein